jgi:nitrate/nitrite transporter NarK
MSPYRTPPTDESAALADDADVCPDQDLLPVLTILWVGSVARVALGVVHPETGGTQVALAMLAVLVVPYLMKDAIGWWIRRCFRARPR